MEQGVGWQIKEVAVSASPLKGHDARVKLARSPEEISFNREEGKLSAQEFRDVVRRTDLNRPVEDTARLATMLRHANLVIIATAAVTMSVRGWVV
jgi:hypothetical protein